MKILLFLLLSICFCGFKSIENGHNSFSTEAVSADSDLKDYIGIYTFTADSPIATFTITLEQNELYGKADSYDTNKLLKQDKPDTFLSTSSYGSTIVFLRDGSTKKVTGLQLIIQGATLEATRNK